MAMGRKDYERIAGVLAGEYALVQPLPDSVNATAQTIAAREGARYAIEDITASIADIFKQDNPQFDRRRFYLAALKRETIR
jgi:hypothetical protein